MPMPLATVTHNIVPLFGQPTDRGRSFKIVILSEGFTTAELGTGSFGKAAAQAKDSLLAASPFRLLTDRIAIVRIDCQSITSSAGLQRFEAPPQPPPPPLPPNYLNQTPFSAVWNPAITRSIAGDAAAVKALVALHPELAPAQAILVLINNARFGGAASDGVGWVTLANDFTSRFIHELGHSAFGLGDEYDYLKNPGENRTYQGFEPAKPNITIQTNPTLIKWHDLVTQGVPLPTTKPHDPAICQDDHPVQDGVAADALGLFEGGGQNACGIFRAALDCRMRHNNQPFCLVCDRVGYSRVAGLLQAGQPIKTVAADAWTHVVDLSPFTTSFGQVNNLLIAYNGASGALGLIQTFDFHFPPVKPQASTTIDPFRSTLTPFLLAGDRFLLFADFATNRRTIFRVDLKANGDIGATKFIQVFDSNAPPERGYTHVVATVINGQPHILSYDSLSGDVLLERMDSDGAQGVQSAIVASTRLGSARPFLTGWSGLVSLDLAGTPFLVSNTAAIGVVTMAQLHLPTGGSPPAIADIRFTSPLGYMPGIRTHLASIVANGQPMVISYSALDGYAYFYRPSLAGTRLDYQRSVALGIGGLSLLAVGAPALGAFTEVPDARSFYWFYNAARGSFRIGAFA